LPVPIFITHFFSTQFVPTMMLSRAKPVSQAIPKDNSATKEKKKSKPELEDFIRERDFTGAIILLEVRY
jgi:hypothetical protein